MISKAERQHINTLKQWSINGRAQMREMQTTTSVGMLLKKLLPDQNTEIVFDNIDWLIELIQRELHTQGVKDLLWAADTARTP